MVCYRERLWRLVAKAKYDSMSGVWCSKEVEGSFGVGVWKYIRRGWGVFFRYLSDMKGEMELRLGFDMIYGVGINS
jgi:hypothetical protein